MPLTKRLAEVNGGMIDFESEPGKGTTFWINFPAVQFNPFIKHEEEKAEADAAGRGEVILLMEKDQSEGGMIGRYLTYIGFRVVRAVTRDEALQALGTYKVCLGIVDNLVAETTEGDIIRSLREVGGSSLRLLLLSSRAFAFDIEKYLKSGVDRCLSKPIPLKHLGHVCRELIDGSHAASRILKAGDESTKILSRKKKSDEIVH
jgi:two-component system, sensor histidine kinase